MIEQAISTRPLDDNEKVLRAKFYEQIAGQSDLMDKLSGQLLTLELAIPGVYAVALSLTRGNDATVTVNAAFYVAFGCWLAALIFTLAALTPRKWKVDPAVLKQDPNRFSEGLGIEDFFEKSASHKRRLVFASSVLFLFGVFAAIFTLG